MFNQEEMQNLEKETADNEQREIARDKENREQHQMTMALAQKSIKIATAALVVSILALLVFLLD